MDTNFHSTIQGPVRAAAPRPLRQQHRAQGGGGKRALKKSPMTLKSALLTCCSRKGAEALASALAVNTLLQVLDMRGNAVSPVGVKALEECKASSKVADRQVLLPLATRS